MTFSRSTAALAALVLSFQNAAAQPAAPQGCPSVEPSAAVAALPRADAVSPFTRQPYGEPVNRPHMNGPVVAFMDAFWDSYDKTGAVLPPRTLGGLLDLARYAYLAAYEAKGGAALARGISPVLTLESTTRGSALNTRGQRPVTLDFKPDTLRTIPLSADPHMAGILALKDRTFDDGFSVAVRFNTKYDHMVAFVAQNVTKGLAGATMDTPVRDGAGGAPGVASAGAYAAPCYAFRR